MMMEPNWNALARAAERAEGADRDLDADVAAAFGAKRTMQIGHECLGNARTVPAYFAPVSGSVDAAGALVARKLPGWEWSVDSCGRAYLTAPEKRAGVPGTAATPALALLSALFTALALDMTPA